MTTGRLTDAVRRLSDRVRADDRSALPDGHLLTLFLEHRDEPALEALVRRHGPMVMGVCRRLLGNEPDAEDAFQATFLVLVRKAKSVRPREMVGHWLYGVARTTAVRAKAARTKRRTREAPLMEAPDARTTDPAAGDDLLTLLDQEISRLPEKYRVPIVLCELGGKSHKEAADQLGWPIGTLSGRLSRGRQMLADRLARRGVQLTAAALATSVSGSLTADTVRHANLLAAGGSVPDRLLTLTEGVVKAMFVNKLKVAVPVLMAVIACGAVGVAYRPLAADEPSKPVEKKANAEPVSKPRGPVFRAECLRVSADLSDRIEQAITDKPAATTAGPGVEPWVLTPREARLLDALLQSERSSNEALTRPQEMMTDGRTGFFFQFDLDQPPAKHPAFMSTSPSPTGLDDRFPNPVEQQRSEGEASLPVSFARTSAVLHVLPHVQQDGRVLLRAEFKFSARSLPVARAGQPVGAAVNTQEVQAASVMSVGDTMVFGMATLEPRAERKSARLLVRLTLAEPRSGGGR